MAHDAPTRRHINIRLRADLADEIDALAVREGLTRTEVITFALTEGMVLLNSRSGLRTTGGPA